uniref:Uncharacterized protein n=1 Tax=Pavo cristatus TaxID=9049 RepID=A0A8C9FR94_PAVCR
MSIFTIAAIIEESVIYFSFLIMLKIYISKSGHLLCSHSIFDILPVLTTVKIRLQSFICSRGAWHTLAPDKRWQK